MTAAAAAASLAPAHGWAAQGRAGRSVVGRGIVVAADNNLQISLKGTLKISQFPEQLEPSNFTNQKLF